jgi:uncharacterized membrane protein
MADTVTTPRRRWLRWALIASLALNLLILSLVAGVLMRGTPGRMVAAAGLWHYGHALPAPYRHDLGRALRASRGDWDGPRKALRGQRAELAAALRAEPFEIATVEAVLNEEAQIAGDLARRGTGLLLTQIDRMDPAERASYAEALMEAPRRSRRDDRR